MKKFPLGASEGQRPIL